MRIQGLDQRWAHLRPLVPTSALVAVGLPDTQAILTSIGEIVYEWDIGTDRLTWGSDVAGLLGTAMAAESGADYAKFLDPESSGSRYDAVMGSAERDDGKGVAFQVRYGLVADADQDTIWIEDRGRWFAGSDTRPARAHGIVRVVTQRHDGDASMRRRAHFDPLTETLNRAALVEMLGPLLATSLRTNAPFCVLLASIENLTIINRSYGFDVADEIIAGVANRLRATMRGTDTLARYSGNKFAVILSACDGAQMAVAAERFRGCVSASPIASSSGPVACGVRIGGVVAPLHARETQALLQRAEEALDCSRAANATRFCAYEPNLVRDDVRFRTLSIAEEIVTSLNGDRVLLALQPIVASQTRAVASYEALMRVRREDGTLVPPDNIFPVAEKVGLVQLIDQRVLELALKRLQADPDLRLAINASPKTIHDPDWPKRLSATLGPAHKVTGRLTIELTETCAIEDLAATQRVIRTLKNLGLRVAMDDFGSGHTSFRSLRALDIDVLKIDGAFMRNIAHASDDRFFVKTLIDLARHLDIPTVAEWVQDEETAAILCDWGIDFMQGNLFGHAQV